LPWEKIDPGLDVEFLWDECERTLSGSATPDCRWNACSDCGVCSSLDIEPVLGKDELGCQRFE
jgi:hypothetical protein